MQKILLLAATLLFWVAFPIPTLAVTFSPGSIAIDTTWTKAGGPSLDEKGT